LENKRPLADSRAERGHLRHPASSRECASPAGFLFPRAMSQAQECFSPAFDFIGALSYDVKTGAAAKASPVIFYNILSAIF